MRTYTFNVSADNSQWFRIATFLAPGYCKIRLVLHDSGEIIHLTFTAGFSYDANPFINIISNRDNFVTIVSSVRPCNGLFF